MNIDIKQIFVDTFMSIFENVIWLVPIVLILALYLFFFRYEISYNLDLTKRERNKLTEKSFLAIFIIIGATVAYLYIKEYFLLLSVALSFVIIYILYLIGIINLIAKLLEGRYGR